jgi:hypothetical protein
MTAARAASKIESPAGNEGGVSTVDIRKSDTAVVFIDSQNDVLRERGANWGEVVNRMQTALDSKADR